VFRNKRPKTDEKHIGVEIEFVCNSDMHTIARILEKNNLQDICCLKEDGSIRNGDYYYGHEITLLTKEKTFAKDIRKVCKVLNKDLKASVNASCGLHVHLDMRKRNVKRAFENLTRAQDMLYKMQPETRRKNTYCQPSKLSYNEAVKFDRYQAINPKAYAVHKTLEVRMHTGSTNASKIINWIQLLLILINKRKKMTGVADSLDKLTRQAKINSKIRKYIVERIKTFEPKPVEMTDVSASTQQPLSPVHNSSVIELTR
jgi:hypothetical protein